MREPIMKHRLEIESRLDRVAEVRDWAGERAVEAGFSAGTVNDINVALTEAVTNAIRHGYGGEPGHWIHLSILVDDRAFTVTVRDFGTGFDAVRYESPDLREPRESGYGIVLMKSLMDDVSFHASPGSGTTLTLVKRLDTGSTSAPPAGSAEPPARG